MHRTLLLLGVILMGLLVITGCRKTIPIENPTVTSAKTYKLSDVKDAIFVACPITHWVAKDVDQNTIEATLNIRGHQATVTIPYSTTGFSIQYKSSVNLNSADGKIHPNYNRWVNYLRDNINTVLATKPGV